MTQDFWIIGLAFKVTAGIFAFLAALFTFLAVLENEKHESTKIWFSNRWRELSSSNWNRMPEKLIGIFLKTEKSFALALANIVHGKIGPWLITIIPLLAFNIGILLYFSYQLIFLSFVSSIPLMVWAAEYFKLKFVRKVCLANHIAKISEGLQIMLIGIPFFGGAAIWITFSLGSNLYLSLASALIALPCCFFLILAPFLILKKYLFLIPTKDEIIYALTGVSIGLSFVITFFSFIVGHLISTNSFVPQTFQMLISNVIFDGLTLLFTFKILQWSLRNNSWGRVPLAITFDIIVAAFLACFSLYFGLLSTKNELSINEVLFILIGKSKFGNKLELGPLFWAMHTTFIPTFIYLLLIAIGFLGKLIFIPIKWFFGKGQEHKNPFALTAALFTLLATILTLTGLSIDSIQKNAEKIQEKTEILKPD